MKIVTPEQMARERISRWIRTEKARTNKSQKEMADVLGIYQPNISKRIADGSFDGYELILLSNKLGFDLSKI